MWAFYKNKKTKKHTHFAEERELKQCCFFFFLQLWWSFIQQCLSHSNENTQKLHSEQRKTKESAVSALNWHKPWLRYIVHSIIRSWLAGNCHEHFVGRKRVSRQATFGNKTLNNCQIWLASAEKLFGSIWRGFYWIWYQYCSPQFHCFKGSHGLPTFFPMVPSNKNISSLGTTSWSSFISFDSFSAFPPCSFFSPI